MVILSGMVYKNKMEIPSGSNTCFMSLIAKRILHEERAYLLLGYGNMRLIEPRRAVD